MKALLASVSATLVFLFGAQHVSAASEVLYKAPLKFGMGYYAASGFLPYVENYPATVSSDGTDFLANGNPLLFRITNGTGANYEGGYYVPATSSDNALLISFWAKAPIGLPAYNSFASVLVGAPSSLAGWKGVGLVDWYDGNKFMRFGSTWTTASAPLTTTGGVISHYFIKVYNTGNGDVHSQLWQDRILVADDSPANILYFKDISVGFGTVGLDWPPEVLPYGGKISCLVWVA